MKPQLSVCLTPELIERYDLTKAQVVIIDVLRATTCMCVGLDRGLEHIVPVETPEQCLAYRAKGYLVAGERDGKPLAGFDFGNSPYSYLKRSIVGKRLAMTTTNGTRALALCKNARLLMIGAFANFTALVEQLEANPDPIILVCSGWKGRVNIEDTLLAGSLVNRLMKTLQPDDDALVAQALFEDVSRRKGFYLRNSPHRTRVQNLGIEADIKYCLKQDTHPVVPVYVNGRLVPLRSLVSGQPAHQDTPTPGLPTPNPPHAPN